MISARIGELGWSSAIPQVARIGCPVPTFGSNLSDPVKVGLDRNSSTDRGKVTPITHNITDSAAPHCVFQSHANEGFSSCFAEVNGFSALCRGTVSSLGGEC